MSERYVPVWVSVLLGLFGVVCVVIGVIYIAESASSLPSFFPGHESVTTSHHHSKHGIAAIILGLGAFAAAWIGTGTKNAPAASSDG